MKGGKKGRDPKKDPGGARGAAVRGKPKKGAAKTPSPGTGAPPKGSRKRPGYGGTSSAGDD